MPMVRSFLRAPWSPKARASGRRKYGAGCQQSDLSPPFLFLWHPAAWRACLVAVSPGELRCRTGGSPLSVCCGGMSPTDASRLPAGYPRARSGVRASWGLSYRNPVNDIWLTSISVTITLSFIRKSSMAFLVGAWVADGSMLQLYARSVLAWRCSLSPLASGPPGDCHEPHLSSSLERCAEALRGGAGKRARRAGRRFAECKSDAVDGDHGFVIEPVGASCTRLSQVEDFSGVLIPLFSPWLRSNVLNGFVQVNEAIKRRAESASATP